MFSKKKSNNQISAIGKVETFISTQTHIKGNITTKGTLRIDGKIEGDIKNAEGIIIGENGAIKGNINAQTVVIGGKVTGNITASSGIEMLATAQIFGDITTPQLSINEGVLFEGHCNMTKLRKEETVNLSKEKILEGN